MNYYTYSGNLKDRNKFTSTANTTFGTRRYFSSLDSDIFFGSKQMDEVFNIEFVISEPKLPIYGYNSFYANRIVSGRRVIQGTFAVNFTHTNHMLKVLGEIEDSVLVSKYESVINRCEGEDTTGLGIGNSAIFDKLFDITISYGYGKTEGMQTFNSCYQTLVGVKISEYRQALDTEGNPILDMYTFVAKDIKYNNVTNTVNNESTNNENNDANSGDEGNNEESYLIANTLIDDDYSELYTETTNTGISGFAVTPVFNNIDGQYSISLKVETINNNTQEFKDVSVTIIDQANSINSAYTVNSLMANSDTILPLEGSARTLGATLNKNFTADENYQPNIAIEFTALINDKEVPVKFQTTLFPGF